MKEFCTFDIFRNDVTQGARFPHAYYLESRQRNVALFIFTKAPSKVDDNYLVEYYSKGLF